MVKLGTKWEGNTKKLNNLPLYGWLHASSCGGLLTSAAMEGPFGPKGEYSERTKKRMYGQTEGQLVLYALDHPNTDHF